MPVSLLCEYALRDRTKNLYRVELMSVSGRIVVVAELGVALRSGLMLQTVNRVHVLGWN